VFKGILLIVFLVVVAVLVYIRVAPSDPTAWHVDPLSAPVPNGNGWLLRPEGGNGPAPVLAMDVTATLAALDAIAMATPRTTRLAGSPEEGRITYVTRSALMGFPDYTTVAATPVPEGTALSIYARQRFGSQDIGVNQARVEAWVLQLSPGAS
jgi:hypothetical protein